MSFVVGESTKSKGTKRDFCMSIPARKKVTNRLVVDEVINNDNLVVLMHPETMKKLGSYAADLPRKVVTCSPYVLVWPRVCQGFRRGPGLYRELSWFRVLIHQC